MEMVLEANLLLIVICNLKLGKNHEEEEHL
jgi:hypothetical protein